MNIHSLISTKSALIVGLLGVVYLLSSIFSSIPYRPGVMILMIAVLFYVLSHKVLRSYTFTTSVLCCVGIALLYPGWLIRWGNFELSVLIVPLTQLIMFGMGTTLSVSDFSKILAAPWAVLVGVLLQFGIMPVVGYFIATGLGLEGDLAAGIVLIGSVSGGVASNLMAFIAKANVALSVTMTIVSTFVAPIMTPLLMSYFAGKFIPIDTLAMAIGVMNIIVVPVMAGILCNSILYSQDKRVNKIRPLALMIFISIIAIFVFYFVPEDFLGMLSPLRNGIILGLILIALVALAKIILNIIMGKNNNWMDRVLPLISMAGICLILAVIIAQTHDVLIQVGGILVIAAVLHNTIGYILGYWGARGFGSLIGRLKYRLGYSQTNTSVIHESDCRTVAFEVGMQNGGMATGLAMDVLKSHIAALPPNLFGTWMNISGSVLANYWHGKTPTAQLNHTKSKDVE